MCFQSTELHPIFISRPRVWEMYAINPVFILRKQIDYFTSEDGLYRI